MKATQREERVIAKKGSALWLHEDAIVSDVAGTTRDVIDQV